MKYTTPPYALIALVVLSFAVANAQTNATKHYEKNGLAFNYPQGWEIADGNSEGGQTVTLTRKGSVAQIVVTMQDGLRFACDFQSERKKIAEALRGKLANNINARTPRTTSSVTTQIAGAEVEGAQLRGLVNHQPVTGAFYSTRLNRMFVSLIYIVAAEDELAQSAWDTVRISLTIEPKVLTVLGAEAAGSSKPITSGVLNGKTIVLPRPEYPRIARSAHAAGMVTVQVVIDESGNVISAHAISGHPLLQASSVSAAKEAKFSETKLCGEPVRVMGVITYNFVAQ